MIEVSHQVNSPLAAIRNAIYLAAKRTDDPEIIQYLAIADDEITSIVNRIRDLRAEVEANCGPGPPISALLPATELDEAA
jgi:signal transduction histidine kinase